MINLNIIQLGLSEVEKYDFAIYWIFTLCLLADYLAMHFIFPKKSVYKEIFKRIGCYDQK
jgi:hypothetical protein